MADDAQPLTEYEVTVKMARRHQPGGPTEYRPFVFTIPAVDEKAARRGGIDIGLGLNEATGYQWKLADDEDGPHVRPVEQKVGHDIGALPFHTVSAVNRQRCERWHAGYPDSNDGWTGADWSNAAAGEMGETCNIVKKLRRLDTGMQQAAGDTRDGLLAKLATEIGDTFIYLDLLATYYGLDMARCVADTFNRVSVREGFPERIEVAG